MKNYKDDILCHYGIKGQKHGHRRFQNEDGSLTAAGRARYLEGNKSAGIVGGTAKAVTGMYTNARNAISKAADEANRRRMAASGKSSASRVSSDTTDVRLGRRTISRRNDDGSHTSETRYSNKFAEKQGEGFVSTRTNKDGSYQNTYKVAGGGFERYDSKTGKTTRVSPERHEVIKDGKNVAEEANRRHTAYASAATTRADRRAGTSYGAARSKEDAARKEQARKNADSEKYWQTYDQRAADRKADTSYGAARSAEDARRKQAAEAAAKQQQQQTETRRAQERRAGMGMNAAMAQSKAKQAAQEKANDSRSRSTSSLGTALNNLKRRLDTAAAQKKADDEKKKRQRSGRRGSYYGG